ncbi:MAG: dephospho-CoA kinase [Bdellovibrionales bacterium]|nr:dephospho-CoA kinase [Bdellovibrionales bacterium]
MKRIGLTGGIGSGKTTVAKLLQAEGIPIVDADEVARDLRKPGAAGHQQILARFGTDDRLKLREIITQDTQARVDLEAILHPLILQESRVRMDDVAMRHPEAPFLIYEATLLIEAGRHSDFDGILVVTAPEESRIQRILTRDPMSREQAQAVVQAQNLDDYRLKHATWVIENDGGFDDLKLKVRKALEQIRQS